MFDDAACRTGVKRILSAMLFGGGPLRQWPRDASRHFPPGTKLASVISAITEEHHAIAQLFGTGIGHTLAFMESNVLMDLLAALHMEGITALPLHDSVLVARSRAKTTKAIMESVLEEYLRGTSRAAVKIDYHAET